jgi:hypothetical protein
MKRAVLFIFYFALIINAFAQERSQQEIHAAMIYNFIKYVQWPNEAEAGEFVLGVIGDEKIFTTLKQWYEGKSKGSKKFIIKKLDAAAQAGDCQAVYVGSSKNRSFDDIKIAVAGKAVLTITDGNGMAEKGSCINFKVIEGKLRFELNQSAVAGANLKVSGQLTSMAILI